MQLRRHIDVIREHLALPGGRVLDVGCGGGALARALAKCGAQVVGIDPNPANIAAARASAPVGGESFVEGRAEALPVGGGTADGVVFLNSLHHVPVGDQTGAVSEAGRVLRPGGVLLAIEPLAEGAFFDLVRPIEDETEVRAAALAALRSAPAALFEPARELLYRSAIRHADFDAFVAAMLAADPDRREAIERHRDKLRVGFAEVGRQAPDGVWFEVPFRASVLRRRLS